MIHSTLIDFSLPIWGLCLIGFCSGTIASLFGVGGGIITTPFLHGLGIPMPFAVAWSSPVISTNSITATLSHLKKNMVQWKSGAILALVMIPILEVATRIMRHASHSAWPGTDTILRSLFMFVVVTSLILVTRAKESPEPEETEPKGWTLPRLLISGTGAGAFAGILGLGGGRIIVPALLLNGLTLKQAMSTSSMIISFSSTYTMLSYLVKGMVDVRVVAWMVGSALVGAFLGARAMHRMQVRLIKKLYILLTIMGVTTMGLTQLGNTSLASTMLMAGTSIIVLLAYGSTLWTLWKKPTF